MHMNRFYVENLRMRMYKVEKKILEKTLELTNRISELKELKDKEFNEQPAIM